MPKFAINYVYTRTYEVDYVIEADDEDEARRKADDLLYDDDFCYQLDTELGVTDDAYEVGEVLPLDSDINVGEFFFEPTNS